MAATPFNCSIKKARAPCQNRLVVQKPPEVGGECSSRGIARRRLLFHCLEDDGFQVSWDRGFEPAGMNGLLFEDLADELVSFTRLERRAKRQQLVKSCTQRVDIGSGVDQASLATQLLRAHVAQGADKVTRSRQVVSLREATGPVRSR